MGIASLTAASLARPLHTLQRWWQQLHPSSPTHVHATWLQNGGRAVRNTTSAISVLTLRRSRGRAAFASTQEDAPSPVAHGLALPALWRVQNRDLTQRTCEIRLDVPVRHKFQRTMPSLRVLHRPTNLARPGGLVIAGRMADVCAELDRLVAMEALH